MNGEKDGKFFIGEIFEYVFVSLAGRSSGGWRGIAWAMEGGGWRGVARAMEGGSGGSYDLKVLGEIWVWKKVRKEI